MEETTPTLWDGIVKAIYEQIAKFLDWVLSLLPGDPVQAWNDISSMFGPTLKYFAWLSALDTVPFIIITAIGIRFLIKLIPTVG